MPHEVVSLLAALPTTCDVTYDTRANTWEIDAYVRADAFASCNQLRCFQGEACHAALVHALQGLGFRAQEIALVDRTYLYREADGASAETYLNSTTGYHHEVGVTIFD